VVCETPYPVQVVTHDVETQEIEWGNSVDLAFGTIYLTFNPKLARFFDLIETLSMLTQTYITDYEKFSGKKIQTNGVFQGSLLNYLSSPAFETFITSDVTEEFSPNKPALRIEVRKTTTIQEYLMPTRGN